MRSLKYYVLTVYVERTDCYRSTVVTSLRAIKSLIDGIKCDWWVWNKELCLATRYTDRIDRGGIVSKLPYVWMDESIRKASSKVSTLADHSVGYVSRFQSLAMAG